MLPWQTFGSGLLVNDAWTGVCITIGNPFAYAGEQGFFASTCT